ncbi:MAG: hypothetical protein KF838_02145 [Phycisphaeraceae bacterium]|nr:MAG: hypothetical protein KF838_02145 [Phycisphaeraceae bacterium]
MARKKTINSVLAGSFLVGAVVLAVFISFMLSDAEFTRTSEYEFRFPLKQGAPGIEPGSFVMVGGQKVGRVTDVEFLEDQPGSGVPTGVRVFARIRASIVIYENALVYIERPILGALSSINIASVGSPDVVPIQGGTPRLEPGEWITGKTASALMAQAGLPPEGFAGLFAKFEELTDKTTAIVDDIRPSIKPNVEKLNETIENVREMTASTRERLPVWRGQMDTIFANSEAASERFPELMDKADLVIGDVQASAKTVNDLIEANAPKISGIIDDVAETTRHVREQSLADLDATFSKAKASIDSFGEAVRHLDTLARQETPNIRRMFANGRLASDQLKLLTTELRAQPWRALIRPSTKELEQQLVYDAARAYADAVSDLRAASETLEIMSVSPSGQPQDPARKELLETLLSELKSAFEEYKRAESQLLEQMITNRP